MSTTEFYSRNELHDYFQQRLVGTQRNLSQDQRLDKGQEMVKTYVIESNVSAEDFLEESEIITTYSPIDAELYRLDINYGDGGTYYLDASDNRFWSLYTLEGSQSAQQTFNRLTTTDGNGLDHPWIPNGTQKEIIEWGEFQGAGLKQLGEDAFPPEYIKEQGGIGDLRLDLNGEDTNRIYSLFQDDIDIEKILSLSRVKIRHSKGSDYITERITSDGAFTARGGTNIQLHLDIVEKVKNIYREMVHEIEGKYRLSYSEVDHGTRVNGKHLRIDLENRINDIEEFLSYVVNAKNPFRLMGTTTQLSENYYKMKGVDLHNGDKITLEVGPTWIRVYLYDDACGNTALRIFSNIQQHYDPAAVMDI
ncbi:hypothetical protein [Halorussus salinus]|uniref:hypothetical protein n=1 Tax=Halorussus salinus TaxID=1364935 RepID=UPI001092754D|nr:hypothetical protein [Halorussus salinus]